MRTVEDFYNRENEEGFAVHGGRESAVVLGEFALGNCER